MVYSRTRKDHERHLRTILGVLREKALYAKFNKYEFWLDIVIFLGYIISSNGLLVDSSKVKVVANWQVSTTVTNVRSFLDMARYYRRFIKGFFKIATPLTQLTKKKVKFEWDEDCEVSF